MLRFLKAEAGPAGRVLVSTIATIVIGGCPLLVAILREIVDEPALSEVVVVSSLDLTPFASFYLARASLLAPPIGFPFEGGLLHRSAARITAIFVGLHIRQVHQGYARW